MSTLLCLVENCRDSALITSQFVAPIALGAVLFSTADSTLHFERSPKSLAITVLIFFITLNIYVMAGKALSTFADQVSLKRRARYWIAEVLGIPSRNGQYMSEETKIY